MYGFGAGGWGVGGWVTMVVLMLVFWGGVVAVVIFLVRRSRWDHHATHVHPTHHDAERILHERFARGEIDESEYVARHTALRREE
jgi:putative membrane protein